MSRRKLTTNLLVAAVIVTVTAGGAVADELAAAGSILSNHQMEDMDGQAVSLEEFRGEVVVVNFWASWCAPCLRELPVLDGWDADWRQKGARVVAVSIDNKARNAWAFADKAELGLTVWVDGPQGLAEKLDLKAVPTSYVIDRDGRVVLRIVGSSEQDLEKMHRTVQVLLANQQEGPEA